VSDATLNAARETLDESLQFLVKELEDLPAERLNARPAGADSNSLSVIAVHALSSTRYWLGLAMGAVLPERDRDSEFRTVADDGFLASVEQRISACRELLAGVDAYDPGRTATAPWRSGRLEPVTAAWALLHALTHLREHVGQAQLTRQLLDRAS
jgi:uncharacterized damage-inducible protein DinB